MAQEQIQLPRPTGPYSVGVTTYFLKDTSRHYNDETGRALSVQMYYPCVEIQKEYPAYLASAMHLYKERLSNNYSQEDLAYLDEIHDWAMPDAPIVEANDPFPVLFFSHGFFMAAQLYSSLIEELASHGYAVVAINHTGACWPVVFPDGSSPIILPELANIFSNEERSCLQTFDITQETWIKDIEFVISWLHNQQITTSLDLSRMGIFGHSYGGSTATEATRTIADFKVMANLDGLLFGPNWDKPFKKPSLFVAAEKQTTHEEAVKAGLSIEQFDSLLTRNPIKVYELLEDNSFYVMIQHADHATFADSKFIKSPLYKKNPDSLKGIETTRALLVDFFDHYLKNKKLMLLRE